MCVHVKKYLLSFRFELVIALMSVHDNKQHHQTFYDIEFPVKIDGSDIPNSKHTKERQTMTLIHSLYLLI